MKRQTLQPQEFSAGMKFAFVFFIVVLVVVGYVGMQVLGNTRIGITLGSQETLNNNLIHYWTFDGGDTSSEGSGSITVDAGSYAENTDTDNDEVGCLRASQ